MINKSSRRKKVERNNYYNNKTIKFKKPQMNYVNKPAKKYSDKELIVFGVIALILIILSLIFMKVFLTITMISGWFLIIYIGNNYYRFKKNALFRKIIKIMLILFILGFITFIVSGSVFSFMIVKNAPPFTENKLNTNENSEIFDKDGLLIAKVGAEKREKVKFRELSSNIINGVIATEDSRFFNHNGLDFPRFFKATLGQLMGKNVGGASTLSMQVVGNYYTDRKVSSGIAGIKRKFTDIYLAIFKLEAQYTKEEIFEFYINNLFAGNHSYGVEQASQTYFGKPASELSLSEASIIAGIYQAPSLYDPIRNPKNATRRRSTVLRLMERHGYINAEQREIANSIPISSLIREQKTSNNEYQPYIDTVLQELAEKGYNPSAQSLKIYTNLDREKQKGLNDIMDGKTFKWKDDKVQAGMIAIDSASGKIEAVGAGRNRKTGDLNFATDKNMKKQSGSTAKPIFDYAPGIEFNGWSTGTVFIDEPHSYTNGPAIKNSDGAFWGPITLKKSLAFSKNIPALKAFQQTDNKKILQFVQKLGLKPEVSNGRIHEAHALGAYNGTNPEEMAAAYAAFANGGKYYEPHTVKKIVNKNTGQETEFIIEPIQVMKDSTAFLITKALQAAVNEGLARPAVPNGWVNIAAKTGTTNYDREIIRKWGLASNAVPDLWLVGYDSKTTLALWYGYDKIYHGYSLIGGGRDTIARNNLFKAGALAVFKNYNTEFKAPDSVEQVAVVIQGNELRRASPGTPAEFVMMEWFAKGTVPEAISYIYNKLPNVTNLSTKKNGQELTLSWNKVNEPDNISSEEKASYGRFGYKVFLNDKLLGFTTKNTYTISPFNDKNGVFKIVTCYESFNDNASTGTTLNYSEKPTTLSILVKNIIATNNNGLGFKAGKFMPSTNDITVKDNELNDITNDPNISKTININKIYPYAEAVTASYMKNNPGTYTIKYTVSGYGITEFELVTIKIY